MSFLFNWFSRKTESEDYEQILSSLAEDIRKRQSRLADIRLRERRSTLLTTLYTLALWVLYVSLWYTQVLPNLSGHARKSGIEKAVKGAPVVIGPIVILFIRRIVQLWYTRISNAEEKTLKIALKQQRKKIEEIKKKTNYDNTRNLLERFDESPFPANAKDPNSASRRRIPGGLPQSVGPQAPVTPQRNGRPLGVSSQVSAVQPQTPISSALQSHLAATPQPIQPLHKQWYDKLADALLGDDEAPPANASRYALICEKCFNHNGLVKESMWEDAQYTCPKCGHFNASARSKKSGSVSSPNTPYPNSPISSTGLQPNRGSAFVPPIRGPVGTIGESASSAGAGTGKRGRSRMEEVEEPGNESIMEVDES